MELNVCMESTACDTGKPGMKTITFVALTTLEGIRTRCRRREQGYTKMRGEQQRSQHQDRLPSLMSLHLLPILVLSSIR